MHNDRFTPFDVEDATPRLVGDGIATQTIDVADLFTTDVTASGSFDLRGVHATSLGKLLQALPIPALLVRKSGIIVYANEACRKGDDSTTTFEGLLFPGFFPKASDRATAKGFIEGLYTDRKPRIMEAALRIGKRKMWGRMNFRSIRMGQERSILVLIEDLTLEKQQLLLTTKHQEELRKAHGELEKRVQERTTELVQMNEQLRREIAERKRVAEELRASEQRYRAVVEDQTETICRFRADGTITFANDAFCRYSGWDKTGVIGRSFFDALSDKDHKRTGKHLQALTMSRPFATLEYRVTSPAGHLRWWRRTDRAIFDDQGSLIEFQSVGRDITQRKLAEEQLKQSLQKSQRILGAITTALGSAIEKRDPYTAGHQQRVALLAAAIAEEMGLSDEQIRGIRVAGVLHDIGKICVPSEILSKPGVLTTIELEMMKTHCQVGYDILKEIEFPWPVAEIVLQHHERMDGSGYPAGIAAESILLEARITAVADVVESMASHRPYRPARGMDMALEEIADNRGSLYDAAAVDACVTLVTRKGFVFG